MLFERYGYPLALLGLGIIGIAGFSVLYLNQRSLYESVSVLQQEQSPIFEHKDAAQRAFVASHGVWAEVQAQAKDTVVQIFSQIAVPDLLEPYKTPAQGQSYGSGFFINDEGEIITNAHVIANAKSVWIQVPSLGKQIIDVTIVGLCPERDLALLRVTKEGYKVVHDSLGKLPFLPLGDSDAVYRSEEILALGYPLGQHALKSTTGVVSGREQINGEHFIQMSAPINPGNSGGPSLNRKGEVIGVNRAYIQGAQNVGYIIPVNELKIVLDDLRSVKLLRKPFLGMSYVSGSEALADYLGNPHPSGCYVYETYAKSLLDMAGVQPGDMLYEIDGYTLDSYGDMNVPWSEDKISISNYISRLKLGKEIKLVMYRKGKRKVISIKFDLVDPLPVRIVYPDYEKLDYEVIAGMVIMPLTLNHVALLLPVVPSLTKYTEPKEQLEPALVLTNILPDSQAQRSRALHAGVIITEVNGQSVKTMQDLRSVILKGKGQKFLTIKTSSNFFVAFPLEKILQEERTLSQDYRYPISITVKELLKNSPVTPKA